MSRRNRSADAAVSAFILTAGWLIISWGFILACGVLLIPYTIETWAAWLGHAVVIEWWKGLLIGIVVGVVLRTGMVYFAVSTALITWLFAFFGFTGF